MNNEADSDTNKSASEATAEQQPVTAPEAEAATPPSGHEAVAEEAHGAEKHDAGMVPVGAAPATPTSGGGFGLRPPDIAAMLAEGPLEPVDNSETKAFLKAALGYEPPVHLTPKEAETLLRFYAHHEWDGQYKVARPTRKRRKGVAEAIRDEIGTLSTLAFSGDRLALAKRWFGDEKSKPTKEGKLSLHPLLADGLWLAGIVIFIIPVFHFWVRNIPFMQKTL